MNCLLNHTSFILVFLFISWSLNAQVALPTFHGVHASADKPAETPWGSNAGSPSGFNNTWNYMMGYKFTPQTSGKVTKLGGYFNGTKTLRLWRVSSGELLGKISVSDNNSWAYADITPVPVTSDVQYLVAAYLAGNGGAYKSGRSYPTTYGNIRIDKCSYKSNYDSDTYPSSFSNELTSTMYGMADITFVPD
jgi:hypothetical protein